MNSKLLFFLAIIVTAPYPIVAIATTGKQKSNSRCHLIISNGQEEFLPDPSRFILMMERMFLYGAGLTFNGLGQCQ